METFAEDHAPQLQDFQAAALGTVVPRQVLQADHTMHDALNIPFLFAGSMVVQQKDRAVPACEILLQCQ